MTPRLTPYEPLKGNLQRKVTQELRAFDEKRAEIMDEVRQALYDYGGPAELQKLADRVGKTKGCLYAIRSGRTRWPRWDTLFALLPYLGLELRVVRIAYH